MAGGGGGGGLQGMAEMSCWHQRFCLPTLNGSNFPITYSIWVKNSLESYYTTVLKYYTFDHLSSVIFADISSFSSISGKMRHMASFNPFESHSALLVYLLGSNVLSICRSLKKLRNEGSTMFRLSAVQILKKNCFVRKIWIIMQK